MLAPVVTEAPPAGRILIVRLTALGDVVLAAHLARALRAARPGTAIDLLTEARIVPLLERLAVFDHVIGWDRRGADAGLAGVLRVKRRLGEGGRCYRAVLDLQNKLRTRALGAILGAQRRGTLRKRGWRGVLRALLGHDQPIDDRHTLDMYLDAARALELPVDRLLLPASAPSPTLVRAPAVAPALLATLSPATALARRAGRPRLIGLGAGTTHATKRWPHFAALAAELVAAYPGARFVPIGGPTDRADLDALRAGVPPACLDPRDAAAVDPAGLLELLRELDLFVSVDSGASHLAQLIGVPTLVLFGPTSPVRWGPREPGHRALSLGLSCSPCSNVGGPRCPRPDRAHACMVDLDASAVARAARALVEDGPR